MAGEGFSSAARWGLGRGGVEKSLSGFLGGIGFAVLGFPALGFSVLGFPVFGVAEDSRCGASWGFLGYD